MNRSCLAYFVVATFVLTLFGCKGKSGKATVAKDSVFVFHHEPANAVYYWKTVLDINNYEMDFMKKHNVKRMYTKFFDVSTDNLYDGQGEQPVPIATLVFNKSTDSIRNKGIEIVPVVFITVEALRLKKPIAKRIVKRVDDMCRANHIAYNEIQLDCDWTKGTKKDYFQLCHYVKQLMHKMGKGLSSTIRLHQLRNTLPDIDYGVLMLYNTESLQNPSVKNSILSSDAVKVYMRHARSNRHLDFAYPTYEWTLWFRGKKFMGIIPLGESKDVDGTLRHEQSDFNEIMRTKRIIKPSLKDINYPSSTIIYHLDSINLSKYSDHEIEKIYSR